MAQNHIKVIHTNLEEAEETVNDFFKWVEQTGYNVVNSKYHIKEDVVVVMLQYRSKPNEEYKPGEIREQHGKD